MSGDFLARLAERALGAAGAVSPNRAPLFAGPAAAGLIELVEEIEAPAPSRALWAPQAAYAVPAAPPVPEGPAAPPTARPPTPVSLGLPPAPPSREEYRGETAAQVPAAAAEPAPRPAELRPGRPPTVVNRVEAVLTRPASVVPVAAVTPVPVRPQPAPVAPSRAESRAAAPAPVSLPAVEPAIQVTIGRVEVRFIEERPAPARPRPAARPGQSLDEYLRLRDGRAG